MARCNAIPKRITEDAAREARERVARRDRRQRLSRLLDALGHAHGLLKAEIAERALPDDVEMLGFLRMKIANVRVEIGLLGASPFVPAIAEAGHDVERTADRILLLQGATSYQLGPADSARRKRADRDKTELRAKILVEIAELKQRLLRARASTTGPQRIGRLRLRSNFAVEYETLIADAEARLARVSIGGRSSSRNRTPAR